MMDILTQTIQIPLYSLIGLLLGVVGLIFSSAKCIFKDKK